MRPSALNGHCFCHCYCPLSLLSAAVHQPSTSAHLLPCALTQVSTPAIHRAPALLAKSSASGVTTCLLSPLQVILRNPLLFQVSMETLSPPSSIGQPSTPLFLQNAAYSSCLRLAALQRKLTEVRNVTRVPQNTLVPGEIPSAQCPWGPTG